MSEFARSIHATADRVAGQRGGDFSIRLILKPRGAAAGSQIIPLKARADSSNLSQIRAMATTRV